MIQRKYAWDVDVDLEAIEFAQKLKSQLVQVASNDNIQHDGSMVMAEHAAIMQKGVVSSEVPSNPSLSNEYL